LSVDASEGVRGETNQSEREGERLVVWSRPKYLRESVRRGRRRSRKAQSLVRVRRQKTQ
jgi:hypothetical protein